MTEKTQTLGAATGIYTSARYLKTQGSNTLVDELRSSPTAVYFKYTEGNSISNFFKRRNEGELLPMTRFEQFEVTGSCTGSYSTYHSGTTTATSQSGPYAKNFLWIPSMAEVAAYLGHSSVPDASYYVQAAAASIYANGHDSLTFLAELHKVVAMFKGAIRRLGTLLARGRIDKVWLEYRYGWRTLYYDIVQISEVVSELEHKRSRFKQNSGNAVSFVDTAETSKLSSVFNEYYLRTDNVSVSVRGSVVADISPPDFRMDPLATAWELVTYSFIIDWFINFGQWLEALSFLSSSTSYVAAAGYQVKVERTFVLDHYTMGSGYSGSLSQNASATATYNLRVPTNVSYSPQSTIRLDGFKVLDLLAIALGYLRR